MKRNATKLLLKTEKLFHLTKNSNTGRKNSTNGFLDAVKITAWSLQCSIKDKVRLRAIKGAESHLTVAPFIHNLAGRKINTNILLQRANTPQ